MKNSIAFVALLIAFSAHAAPTGDEARAVFDRFRSLEGSWRSKSTQGWTQQSTKSVAAKGSVVVSRSRFDGAPNDGMVSTWFMDGDRLLLTHYCEARNQPTLVLSKIENNGRRVTFTFLSGTNMASRDVGHMDSVVYEFLDDDRYTHRWSWYSKGKETWFETIESERVRQ